MSKMFVFVYVFLIFQFDLRAQSSEIWIRVNQLGYSSRETKIAVLCSKALISVKKFELIDHSSGKVKFSAKPGRSFGEYGPFKDTYRLNFTSFKKKGKYFIRAGNAKSTPFEIGDNVYDSAADFCLKYMRQQRSGFNPYLKDSCHTYDGYTLFAPVP